MLKTHEAKTVLRLFSRTKTFCTLLAYFFDVVSTFFINFINRITNGKWPCPFL